MKHLTFISVSLLLALSLQLALKALLGHNSARGYWSESVPSKLTLLESRPQTEVVIVGTSTALNNFNTQLMGQQGVDTFNFGLAGRFWENYPLLFGELVNSPAPRVLVSLSVKTIFDPVACPQVYGVSGFWYLLRSNLPCLLQNKLSHLLPLASELPYLWLSEPLPTRAELDHRYGTNLQIDPRALNFMRGQGDRKVVTFTNGDGLVLAPPLPHRDQEHKTLDLSQREIPAKNLRYLQETLRLLHTQGKQVVLYFEPYKVDTLIHFDQQQLQAYLGSEVKYIFNHLLKIPSDRWADASHLNEAGNRLYSQLVVCQLKALLHDSSLTCQGERDRLENLP